jgi:thioredoxin 1
MIINSTDKRCVKELKVAVIAITKENFEEEVLKSDKPVLVDFWASWCGPCRMMAPVIEEIADEVTDAKVGKINVDEEPELADAFKITRIPTLVVFKNGAVVSTSVGVRPKSAVIDMLNV